MRVTVWNFCYLKIHPSVLPYKLVYAHSLDVSEEDLYRDKSSLSGDHLEASELINEELADSVSFHYGKVSGNGDLAWVGLLLRKSHLGGRETNVV